MDNPHTRPSLFSPLSITLLGLTSAALFLAVYHCIVNTFYKSRRSSPYYDVEASVPQLIAGPTQPYRMGEGKVCGGESVCAVCLCEFADGEAVRLLPECLHYFHVGCIDPWLGSHSSCPMWRTEVKPWLAQPMNHEPTGVTRVTVIGGGLTPPGTI